MSDEDFLRVEGNDCPMSSCAAAAGSPCRTGAGKVAAQYHTARFRLVPSLAKALNVPTPPVRRPGSVWVELPRPRAADAGPVGHVRIGYARASTARQSLDTQLDSLRRAGVTRVFSEKVSTRVVKRPELDKAVALAREIRRSGVAVTLVVHEHKRLGRGIELAALAEQLKAADIGLEFLTGELQGSHDPSGIVFTVLAALSGMEREYIRDGTLAGHESARARGKTIGGATVTDGAMLAVALHLREQGLSLRDIAAGLVITKGKKKGSHPSPATVLRMLRDYDAQAAPGPASRSAPAVASTRDEQGDKEAQGEQAQGEQDQGEAELAVILDGLPPQTVARPQPDVSRYDVLLPGRGTSTRSGAVNPQDSLAPAAPEVRRYVKALEVIQGPVEPVDGDCLVWEPRVRAALVEAGYSVTSVMVTGWLDPDRTLIAFAHRVTLAGHDIVVDLTARQFDPALPPRWITTTTAYCSRLAQSTGCHSITLDITLDPAGEEATSKATSKVGGGRPPARAGRVADLSAELGEPAGTWQVAETEPGSGSWAVLRAGARVGVVRRETTTRGRRGWAAHLDTGVPLPARGDLATAAGSRLWRTRDLAAVAIARQATATTRPAGTRRRARG